MVFRLGHPGRRRRRRRVVKLKAVCLSMLVCLSMVFGRAGSAQEIQPLEPDWLRQMYQEGWQKVQEGVLKRDAGDGKVETFGYGAEGFQWLIESYRQQLTYFEGKYDQEPSDELASLIDRLRDKINALQDDALAVPAVESFGEPEMAGCTISYEDPMAEAGPLDWPQGVTATASVSFYSTCTNVTANTYVLAYAHAAKDSVATTQTQEEPRNNETSIVSLVHASVEGSEECESRAQA